MFTQPVDEATSLLENLPSDASTNVEQTQAVPDSYGLPFSGETEVPEQMIAYLGLKVETPICWKTILLDLAEKSSGLAIRQQLEEFSAQCRRDSYKES